MPHVERPLSFALGSRRRERGRRRERESERGGERVTWGEAGFHSDPHQSPRAQCAVRVGFREPSCWGVDHAPWVCRQ